MGSNNADSHLEGVQCPNCGGYKTRVDFNVTKRDPLIRLLSIFLTIITLGIIDLEVMEDRRLRNEAIDRAKKYFWQDRNSAYCDICGRRFLKRHLRPVIPNVQLIQKAEEKMQEEERRRRVLWD